MRIFVNHDMVPLKLIIFASTMILFLGIYDDVKGADAKVKFFVQILASILVVYGGVQINSISNPFGEDPINLGIMSVPFTIFWLVGITNAINLIDGLDGLAAGIVLIVSLGLFFVFMVNANLLAALLIIALAGSCLGFLKYNFFPAKIFMGDTGSLFLGFTLATISVLAHHKANTAVMLLVPIVGLGIPIFDTSMAFFRRIMEKRNPFDADDKHIHHFLLKQKLTEKQTVFVLWGLTAFLNLFACLFYYLSVRT
ncbi:MAG: undecaprenyl/decaprenyl-phosphate alpha-N-acetylglucosaminyl 1-phosphate transferase [Candidatus Omnitrophica bacterium]|nr:undecaprenyl/decaprenyl-phosphate alpha-N-acetylglucosaminyl 1-phosphate transferase [Candidatus Omnitrophota bacterium]